MSTTTPPPIDAPRRRGRPACSGLTPREREVVTLLASGLTVKAAAERMGTSPKTVDAQKTVAMKKLDIHNRAALTIWAVGAGLVTA